MKFRALFAGAIVLTLGAAFAAPAQAQITKKLKKAAKDAVEDETAKQIELLVRSGVRCVFNDLACIKKAEDSGERVVLTDKDGEPVVDENGAPITDPNEAAETLGEEPPMRPGEGVWANYDFVPGERVLFVDDFSDDEVGDFPQRLEWVRGNMEIVETLGKRLLRATGANSQFAVLLPEGVPERFTIEFDIFDEATEQGTRVVTAEAPSNGVLKDAHFNYGNWRGELERGDRITFILAGDDDRPIYIGNIRVAEGGRDLYDDLAENGRVSTHGILFGVNSAQIRPESTPTLEEIAEMLQEHPDLRIAIEGHTDNTGDDAHNQELSERRAEAVRMFLVETYGIEPDRLESAGLGESKPVDSNDTPEGRQNNRRVELVKLG